MAAAAQARYNRIATGQAPTPLAPRVSVEISPDTLRAALADLTQQRAEIDLHMRELQHGLARWDAARDVARQVTGTANLQQQANRPHRGRPRKVTTAQRAALAKARAARHGSKPE